MIEVDVLLPDFCEPDAVPRVVEQACALEGLTLTLKGTLKKYPGSLHWHYRQGNLSGTLEVTWWEQGRRLWFKLASGRTGLWTERAIHRLMGDIEQALRSDHFRGK